MLKLEHLNVTFSLNCLSSNLPHNMTYRIVNGLSSYLTPRLDQFNILHLRPLEFYLVHFFLILHERRTESKLFYNELYGNLELDSLFADLLNDYLNFFFPVNDRNLNFPSFSTTFNSNSSVPLSNHHHHHYHHHHNYRQSLLKRFVLTPLGQHTYDDSIAINESDRVNDMQKVDTFIRLLTECLIYTFIDPTSTSLGSKRIQMESKLHSQSKISPLEIADPKQYLANIETVFALSMILKHIHLFSNAFISIDLKDQSLTTTMTSTSSSSSTFLTNKSESSFSIDELRLNCFTLYLRKPFFEFLSFHVENWPLGPSIKWIIELWLVYVQPWRFNNNNYIIDNNKSTVNDIRLKCFNNSTFNFVIDNYLMYVNVYQLIIKRYLIIDLTNSDNLDLLNRILTTMNLLQPEIKTIDDLFAKTQSHFYQRNHLNNRIKVWNEPINHQTKMDMNQSIIKIFNDFNSDMITFRSLYSEDNYKLITNLFEIIVNDKNLIQSFINDSKAKSNKDNFIISFMKLLFVDNYNDCSNNKSNSNTLNSTNSTEVIKKIDQVLKSIELFYEIEENKSCNTDSIQQKLTTKNVTNTTNHPVPDSELAQNGITFKLSPKGRFQVN
jgi:hypothetical protein